MILERTTRNALVTVHLLKADGTLDLQNAEKALATAEPDVIKEIAAKAISELMLIQMPDAMKTVLDSHTQISRKADRLEEENRILRRKQRRKKLKKSRDTIRRQALEEQDAQRIEDEFEDDYEDGFEDDDEQFQDGTSFGYAQ